MLNTLFISENLVKESNIEDVWTGVEKNTNLVELIDYTNMYEANGKFLFEQYILDLINKENIELLVFSIGAGLIIDIYFLKQLNENTSCKIIIMFPDSEHLFEYNDRYYAQTADLTWLLNPGAVELFQLYGINTVWSFGLDIDRYFKKVMPKDIDVSFVGGINRSNRKEYIDFLIEHGIQVELFGYGTANGMINNAKKNQIVARSKINLNFTGVENKEKNILKRVKQAKGRPMEVSILGGFTLSEYSHGIENMFKIDNEIAIFHTKEELLESIKYYLKNDKIRDDMAEKAYNRALNDYETKNSFAKVLNALMKVENVNKTYFIDNEFATRFTSTRFYYMTKFFILGKFQASYYEFKTILKYKNITLKNFYFDIPRGIFHILDTKSVYARKIVIFLRKFNLKKAK